ncbi:MAG: transporter substrate-binding domain-containing protein [Gammaproteobacteria bacterium]|nr:transporter substrate-binding domain-containing protein [Gammaproteobacteria bacterium]
MFRILITATLLSLIMNMNAYALGCQNGTAYISGGSTYPPLSWEHNGKLRGASIDLVTQIFSELDIEVITDGGGPWKRVVQRAKHGKVDMLVGVRRNAEREKFLDFIDPPITPAAQAIFILKENSFKYHDWNDLKGKVGATTLGVSFGSEFDEFAKTHLHIERVKTINQNFRKLLRKRIDYILGPLLPTLLYAEKSGYRYKIKFVRQPFMIIDEYVTFSRLSDCRQHSDYFKKRIAEMTADGSMDELLERQYLSW